MFLLYFLPAIYGAFSNPIAPHISQTMPHPEPDESSPEEPLNLIASYIRLKLTDFQRQWLSTQSEALNISNERIVSDVLAEWLARNRDVNCDVESAGEFLQEALEDFIARHHQEFLPVVMLD